MTQRIAERTTAMFEAGLVAEVEALLRDYPVQGTALQAIGYKEVVEHVRGNSTLTEAVDAVTRATVRYAKRQRTWFRAEKDAVVVSAAGSGALRDVESWLLTVIAEHGR